MNISLFLNTYIATRFSPRSPLFLSRTSHFRTWWTRRRTWRLSTTTNSTRGCNHYRRGGGGGGSWSRRYRRWRGRRRYYWGSRSCGHSIIYWSTTIDGSGDTANHLIRFWSTYFCTWMIIIPRGIFTWIRTWTWTTTTIASSRLPDYTSRRRSQIWGWRSGGRIIGGIRITICGTTGWGRINHNTSGNTFDIGW